MTNPQSDTSLSSRWEALKAYLHGSLVYHTIISDVIKKHLSLLLIILQLDQQCAVNPIPQLLKDGTTLKTEFDLITTQHAEQSLLTSQQNLFEDGGNAYQAFSSAVLTKNSVTHHFSYSDLIWYCHLRS